MICCINPSAANKITATMNAIAYSGITANSSLSSVGVVTRRSRKLPVRSRPSLSSPDLRPPKDVWKKGSEPCVRCSCEYAFHTYGVPNTDSRMFSTYISQLPLANDWTHTLRGAVRPLLPSAMWSFTPATQPSCTRLTTGMATAFPKPGKCHNNSSEPLSERPANRWF